MTSNSKLRVIILIILIIIIYILTNLSDGWQGGRVMVMDDYYKMKRNFQIHEALINKKEELINEIDKLNIEAEIFHEKIISQLHEKCIENDINILKINFSEITPVYLDNESREAIMNETINNEVKINAVAICVTLDFKCEYENMINFINSINLDEMMANIMNVRLLSWNDEEVYGVININFYAMPLLVGER